jgi:PLP dependent protein
LGRAPLETVEGKENSAHQTQTRESMIPAEMLVEEKGDEDGEDRQGNNFLNDLKLNERKTGSADAVGRNLEAVFEERDQPADHDHLPERFLAVFQVAVPCKGHKGVGEDEKHDSSHGLILDMTALKENLERLEEAITDACRAAGRSRGEVELMAVSKTFPAEAIIEAAALGIRLFGENRVQEFEKKSADLGPKRKGMECHLIGHLQSNKAAKAADLFDGIDSLDSVRLAERLNEAAGKLGKNLRVLVEVKLSPEETKEGLEPESEEMASLLERLPGFEHLKTEGLMTIAPWGAPEDITRACFRQLRELRDRWAREHAKLDFSVLSMGMSGDFPLAIAEGATRIRVGTALFGKRTPKALHVLPGVGE